MKSLTYIIASSGSCILNPPSTGRTTPVIKEASSEHKNEIALAISAGTPVLLTGYCNSNTQTTHRSVKHRDLYDHCKYAK